MARRDLIVVYDACVLFPAPLRSFLMYLALTDLFQAKWTDDIHAEWMRSVRENYPDITQSKVERIRDLMNSHVRDCLITGYDGLVSGLCLPDPDDRHVLAAAIRAEAQVIVTANLSDFPASELAKHGIKAQHPDEFLQDLLAKSLSDVCGAAKRQRQSLKTPPLNVDEFLAVLDRQGLRKTVATLRKHVDLL